MSKMGDKQQKFDPGIGSGGDLISELDLLDNSWAQGGLRFNHTREDLNAITVGLSPTSADTILAISGCGDQLFALLAEGPRVVAVDNNPAQIEFLRERQRIVREGDILGFCGNINQLGVQFLHSD